MLSRYLFATTLLGFVLAPSPARPADQKVTPPTVQVRLNSLDRTLDDVKYFLSLTGQKQAADQLDGLKGALPNGFDGIDTKKPWALYGVLESNVQDSAAVLLVPVTSEKAFLSLLENVAQLKPTKDGDVYMVQPPNLPVAIYFRFVEGYACAAASATPAKGALEKGKLIPPSVMFSKPIAGGVDVHFRVDQIPNEYKQMALGAVEVQLANAEEQKIPGENEAQRLGRLQGIKSVGQLFKALVSDGSDISFNLDISRERGRFGVGFGLGGKSGSDLAKRLASMDGGASLFAGWVKPTSAMNLVVHAGLAESAQKLLELIFSQAFAGLAKEGEKQKVLAEKLKKVLAPTIQDKSVDLAFDWRGPSPKGLYTLIAGLKVVDGDKIEALVKELIQELPEKERANIKIDASSIGEFKVHRIDDSNTRDQNAKHLFGDGPIYFAFRKDAVYLTIGDNGLAALSEALPAVSAATPMIRGGFNLKGLIPMVKQNDPRAEEFAKKSFVKTGDDAITFSIKGGESLQIRLEATGAVLQFLASLGDKK